MTSDFDFLVDLGEYDSRVHRRFFGLIHALEDLLGNPVDMIPVASIGNPYFRQELHGTRVLLYESRNDKEAA